MVQVHTKKVKKKEKSKIYNKQNVIEVPKSKMSREMFR